MSFQDEKIIPQHPTSHYATLRNGTTLHDTARNCTLHHTTPLPDTTRFICRMPLLVGGIWDAKIIHLHITPCHSTSLHSTAPNATPRHTQQHRNHYP